MNRRQFIKQTVTLGIGIGFAWKSSPTRAAKAQNLGNLRVYLPGDSTGYTLHDLFVQFGNQLGCNPISRSGLDPALTNERNRVENELRSANYFSYGASKYYNTPYDCYSVGHANNFDVCCPFYTNSVSGRRKSMFEASSLVAVCAALPDYIAQQQTAPSAQELTSLFMPTGLYGSNDNWNAIAGTLLHSKPDYYSDNTPIIHHPTDNGYIETNYTPVDASGQGTASVHIDGTIKFSSV